MAKYTAVTDIKHNGDFIENGSEVAAKDFSKEEWAQLLEVGAVEEAKVTVTEAKTDAENEELKARVAELEALLAEAKKPATPAAPAK